MVHLCLVRCSASLGDNRCFCCRSHLENPFRHCRIPPADKLWKGFRLTACSLTKASSRKRSVKRKRSRQRSEKLAYDIETPLLVHARLPVRPDDRLASLQAEARRRDLLAVLVAAEVLERVPRLALPFRPSFVQGRVSVRVLGVEPRAVPDEQPGSPPTHTHAT